MAGYLDQYGVEDVKRAQTTRRVLVTLACAVVAGLALFLFLHNRTEKRTVSRFFDQLREGKYQDAYRDWGCTPATPCRDYSFQKFMEDWGPKGQYGTANAAHVSVVDSCGGGVVMTIEVPNVEPFGLWVDRNAKTLSFAPWPRCPGRHWHLIEFLSRHFTT